MRQFRKRAYTSNHSSDDGSLLYRYKHTRGALEVECTANLAALLASEAEESDQKVGKRVRSARESAGLTQQELSKKTGIEQAIISKLERGSHHQRRVDTTAGQKSS